MTNKEITNELENGRAVYGITWERFVQYVNEDTTPQQLEGEEMTAEDFATSTLIEWNGVYSFNNDEQTLQYYP